MDDYILTLHGLVAEITETDGDVIADDELAALTPTEAHELTGLLRDRAARTAFLRRYIDVCPAAHVLPALHPLDAHCLPAFAACLLRRATEDPGIVALLVSALIRGTIAPTLTQWMLVTPSVASVIVDTAALMTGAAAAATTATPPWVIDLLAVHGEALQMPHAFRLLAPLRPDTFRRVISSADTDIVDTVRSAAPTAPWTLHCQYDDPRPWTTSAIGRTLAAFTVYAPLGCFLYVDRIHLYGSANKTEWVAEPVYTPPPAVLRESIPDVPAADSPIDISTAGPSPSSDSGYASDVSLQESYTVLDLLQQNRRHYEQTILIESRVEHYALRHTQAVIRLDPDHMHTGIRIVCDYEYVSRIELYGEAVMLC